MKAKMSFVILAIIVANSTIAQNYSINFEKGSWTEIKEKAKKQNKLIFVDVYTTWCAPCKWMDKNVFTNDTVAEFYNQNFINVKIDAEKGEGPQLKNKYHVIYYPTYLFVDKEGEDLHRGCGIKSKIKFVEFGQEALLPDKRLSFFLRKYDSGERDPYFLYRFLEILLRSCESGFAYVDVDSVLSQYFATQNNNELFSKRNWLLIRKHVTDINSREFKFLVKNADRYAKIYLQKEVESKISDVFLSKLYNSLFRQPEFSDEDFSSLKQQISGYGYEKADKVILEGEIFYSRLKEDWQNYIKSVVEYTRRYSIDDPIKLCVFADNFYEKTSDEKLLELALGWSQRVSEKEKPFNYLYALEISAKILFKLGRKQEAIRFLEKAIKLTREIGEDSKLLEQLLHEMEK